MARMTKMEAAGCLVGLKASCEGALKRATERANHDMDARLRTYNTRYAAQLRRYITALDMVVAEMRQRGEISA